MLDARSRGIHRVRPAPWADGDGHWSCSDCCVRFTQRDSWLIDFRHTDGREFSFVICPACARDRIPVRLGLHVTDTPPDDVELRPVVDRASEVAELRRAREPVVLLRATDVDELADQLGTSPGRLAQRLDRAGLLAVLTG